jgi:hypothetical protein
MTSSMPWLLWSCLTASAALAMGTKLVGKSTDRTLFLPGPTSHGHYQIELACQSCHTSAFASQSAMQEACEGCHAADLKAADDSHPKTKFLDPRNADRVEALDARLCVTCHVEHRPDMEQGMGLTLPRDYCWKCHQEVGNERPSHRELTFDSCANQGCHNFHDNRALYEDFLVKHADDPAHALQIEPLLALTKTPLAVPNGQSAVPSHLQLDASEREAWQQSAHAIAGASCSQCHEQGGVWSERVAVAQCGTCHERELGGWQAGRHGMRTAQGLPAMTPSQARLPMKQAAGAYEMTCNSCHKAHGYDTREAATEACLGCHDDEHSRSYPGSPHHLAWQREMSGEAATGSGVSCATCHMPRTERDDHLFVEHNQNANLRPNEKMIRSVCERCHGVPYAIDALADTELIRNNFRARPSRHVASVEMAKGRTQNQ